MAETLITQKIRFYPNNELKAKLTKCFGASRWAYNKSIDIWNEQYRKYKEDRTVNKYPSGWRVRAEMKKELPDWFDNLSLMIIDSVCDDLERAHRGNPLAKLKYRSRKSPKQSCRFYRKNDSNFKCEDGIHMQLPSVYKMVRHISPRGKVSYKRVFLLVKLREKLKFPSKYIQLLTIEFNGYDYYCVVTFRVPKQNKSVKTNKTVGVDLGLKTFATYCFDSENQAVEFKKVDGPKEEIKRLEEKLDRLNRKISKLYNFHKKNGNNVSSNYYKRLKTTRLKVYERIKNVKTDFLNKQAFYLAANFDKIVIEDLNVSGMTKNHKLARAVLRYSFYEFKTKLENKTAQFDKDLILADTFYPSTQRCSHCGYVKSKESGDKMRLKDRIYTCPHCNTVMDRDENAAYNLKLYAEL